MLYILLVGEVGSTFGCQCTGEKTKNTICLAAYGLEVLEAYGRLGTIVVRISDW